MTNQVIDLKDLAKRTIINNGFEIVKFDIKTHTFPEIYISIKSQSGQDITIDQCAYLSNLIKDDIDEAEFFNKPYTLEVSSQGLSEYLTTDREFNTFKGFPVEVSHYDEKDLEIQQKGLLHERSKDKLMLNCKGRIIIIKRASVIKVRLTTS